MTRRPLEGLSLLLALALGAFPSPETAGAAPGGPEAAAKTGGVEIGRPAPDFVLLDTEGKTHRLSDYTKAGNVVVLEWFNPDCPFVKKHHQKHKTMATTLEKFEDENLVWLAINSGARGKQGYGLKRNELAREQYDITYPILLDERGAVGRLYQAKTTPHMYVISADGTLLYWGAIDDNRSPGKLGKTNFVTAALASVFEQREIETTQSKPYGCSVKYGPSKTR
jgi:peroxiredoxin